MVGYTFLWPILFPLLIYIEPTSRNYWVQLQEPTCFNKQHPIYTAYINQYTPLKLPLKHNSKIILRNQYSTIEIFINFQNHTVINEYLHESRLTQILDVHKDELMIRLLIA